MELPENVIEKLLVLHVKNICMETLHAIQGGGRDLFTSSNIMCYGMVKILCDDIGEDFLVKSFDMSTDEIRKILAYPELFEKLEELNPHKNSSKLDLKTYITTSENLIRQMPYSELMRTRAKINYKIIMQHENSALARDIIKEECNKVMENQNISEDDKNLFFKRIRFTFFCEGDPF